MVVLRKICLLPLIFMLVGCSNSPFFLWKDEGDISIEIYKAGKLVKEFKLSPGSEYYVGLKSFIGKGKWKNTYVTYAPDIILRSKKFDINLLRDKVVVNYINDKNHPIQSIWEPTGKDLEALEEYREHILNGITP